MNQRLLRIIAIGLLVTPLSAQKPSVIKLRAPNGHLPQEFIAITGVRELSDGRLLVSDPRDKRIVIADFTAGTILMIGRVGAGPGEYPAAYPPWALAADSSILLDGDHRRWTLFKGDRIVAQLPPDDPAVRAPGLVRGVDTVGHVVSALSSRRRTAITDSTALQLLTRATGRVDTIGWLRPAVPEREGAPVSTFLVWEAAAVAVDGWIAVVRMEPYRVDWRTPDGHWILGRPLPDPPVTFDARERLAYVRFHGGGDYARRRLTGAPSLVPPFSNESELRPTYDGKVLVERTPTAEFPNKRYDVVNRRGELVGQIVMPSGERIVGFGAKSVYVVVRDADDVERIRRHPWP